MPGTIGTNLQTPQVTRSGLGTNAMNIGMNWTEAVLAGCRYGLVDSGSFLAEISAALRFAWIVSQADDRALGLVRPCNVFNLGMRRA